MARGFEAGRQLLSGSGRPDAAFCVTDLLACGFMDAARREFGLDVPADLCVIGFDDIEQAGWASYDLTTFRQPIGAIADRIMTLDLRSGRRGRADLLSRRAGLEALGPPAVGVLRDGLAVISPVARSMRKSRAGRPSR